MISTFPLFRQNRECFMKPMVFTLFGISKKVSELISEKIAIKREKKGAESLNVAIATSILLYEFKR